MARCDHREPAGRFVHRTGVGAALVAPALVFAVSCTATLAFADGTITVVDGYGSVGTTIYVPGSPGNSYGVSAVNPAMNHSPGSAGPTCTYVINPLSPSSNAPGILPIHPGDSFAGTYYFRYCSDGTVSLVWVPFAKAGTAAAAAPAGVAVVTSGQLAREALDRLVLSRPTVHRSPVETNDYQGDPFTWAHISTWFWTNAGDYRPMTHTVSVGPVSATVVARPVGLLFDPGDGGDAVRCPGPGRAWTEADGNDAPSSGCGYRYDHVTDGAVTSRLGILWRVTWTGTGGTGGTLPAMETTTDAPLRVLQIQVVNR